MERGVQLDAIVSLLDFNYRGIGEGDWKKIQVDKEKTQRRCSQQKASPIAAAKVAHTPVPRATPSLLRLLPSLPVPGTGLRYTILCREGAGLRGPLKLWVLPKRKSIHR